MDVGASSEGGEVWGGSAQLLGLRPSTQYEVILLIVVDGGTERWMNEKLLMLLCTHVALDRWRIPYDEAFFMYLRNSRQKPAGEDIWEKQRRLFPVLNPRHILHAKPR